ncbi:MAG: hypothetical protein ACKO5M_05310 [Vulcanococcus sp.]
MARSRLLPLPGRRSLRSPARRGLRALAKASLCLPAAAMLRQLIEQGADRQLLQGQPDLAADALRMLWCPALLAAAGVLFLLQALLVAGAALRRRRVGDRPAPRRKSSQPARASIARRPARPADPHLRACMELGLPPGSSWSEIREHWRRQVGHWHPDRGGDLQRWHQRLAAYRLLREREQRRAAALG